jgi:parallel beta-helix repeat protein
MSRPRLFHVLVALSSSVAIAAPLEASDGKLEINAACAAVGCFAGDSAGFPVTVSNPGSYVLTSNLEVSASFTDGIQITADGVTLDLNGFSLVGPDTGSSGGRGISIEADEAVISNGTVTAFGAGVRYLTQGTHANSTRVVDVTATSNGTVGIGLGERSLVADCTVVGNQYGVSLEGNGIVRGSVVSNNGSSTTNYGIRTYVGGLVEGNVVSGNKGDGVHVFDGSTVLGNMVTNNTGDGIDLDSVTSGRSVARNNASSGNAGYGIATSSESLISGNSVVGNRYDFAGVEIEACGSCTIIDNHAP